MRNRYIVPIVLVLLALLAGCSRNPDAAKKKYFESGMKYYDQQKYDSAAIQFKKALQVDPRYGDAHYQLGMTFIKLEKPGDALKEFSDAVDSDPSNLKARLELGGLYWAAGAKHYGQAEEQARYVIEHDANNPQAYLLLGNVLLGQRHQQDAVEAYNKVLSLDPKNPSAYLNRGIMYASMGQTGDAVKDFEKAIEVDPTGLQGYANLSSYYLYKKDPKKAEEIFQRAITNNPDKPVPYLRLAALLLHEGDKQGSEKVIQDLRDKQPSSADVAGAIGDYYLSARNPDLAIKEYKRGLALNPKSEELQLRLIESLLNTGKTDEAAQLNDAMLKERPGDVMARVTHARLQAFKGDPNAAIATLRDVIKDAPENPQAHFILGQVLRQTGDMAGAKTELQEAVKRQPEGPMILSALAEVYRDTGDPDTAREYVGRLLKINQTNPTALFLAGTIELGAKNYKGAMDYFEEAKKSVPGDPMLYLNEAFAYAGQKMYPESEKSIQTALKIYPQYDAAMGDYVSMMFALKQPDKAVGLAHQYAASNPNRGAAHFIYGGALATTKKYPEAIAEYQKAIAADPKVVLNYVQLGRVYELTNQPDQALAVYQKALAAQPTSANLNSAIGNVYLAKGDLKSAGKYFQAALSQNTHDPIAANNLAWVYAMQGENLDMALSLATQAKQAAPEMESVNDTLAWIQYKKGNYRVSVSLAEDAVKKRPENPDYRYHLGMALAGAGDKPRARTELEKALQLNLKGDDAKDAQRTIASLQ